MSEKIDEGLVFFKESRRLMNLARAIRKRALKAGTYGEEVEDYAVSVEALAKQLKSGDFAALAKTNSDEPRSAANGGEVGLLPEESIQPAIRKALTGLAKGATAGPIELGDGLYFIKVLDIQEPRTATLDEVKPQIIRALRTERQNLNRQAYFQRLQSQTPITLDEIALPTLLKPDDKK